MIRKKSADSDPYLGSLGRDLISQFWFGCAASANACCMAES